MGAVKQADLVKLWGLSKQRVSQYRKEGMPLDSVEAAAAWRAAHYGSGVGNAGKTLADSLAERGARLPPPPPAPVAEDLERPDIAGVYARAQELERMAWEGIGRAVKADESATTIRTRLNTYNGALQSRLKAEEKMLAILRERGDLVPGGTAAEAVGRALGALVVLLRAMPNRLAPKANPGDPDAARAVLKAGVADLISRMQGVCAETLGAAA